MKKILLLLTLSLLTVYAQAKHVTEELAAQAAETYLNATGVASTRSAALFPRLSAAYISKPDNSILRTSGNETVYFYVFNIDGDRGFIIVSGDDKAVPVLGYSMNGAFDVNNMPPAFKEWLNGYNKEIAAVIAEPSAPTHPDWLADEVELRSRTAMLRTASLSTAKWNQTSPYNANCPLIGSSQTVTGCVATGMAIIMKYHYDHHGANITGHGSHSYAWNGRTLSATFGSYNFDNMPLSNLASATAEQKANVARLMFHCGIATEADYYIDGTGAMITNAKRGMTNFFGFSSSMQLLIRDNFTTAEWEQILRDELDNGYPCFYSGDGSSGGHMFICEGYTSDNKYNMNWGWGGWYNGSFSLSTLNPGPYSFNSYQEMVVNIRHDGSLGPSSLIGFIAGLSGNLQFTGLELVQGGNVLSDKIVTVGQTYNEIWLRWMELLNYTPFNGKLGVALFDASNNFKSILRQSDNMNRSSGGIFSYGFTNFKVTSANTGDLVRAVYSTDNGATWNIIYGSGYGLTDALTVIGSGGAVAVSGVTLNYSTPQSLNVDGTLQLQATVIPDNATVKTVTWSSDNSSVATVSSAGLVTAIAAGSATITVTTQDGNKTATCNVTVKSNNANLSAITLSTGALSPAFNAATTSYTVSVPYETTSISVTGTPAHQSATISGNVTNKALSVGSNTVSLVVTAEDGVTTKTYTVTIVREQQIIAVSSVTLSQTSATLNINQTLQLQATVLPQDANNKAVTWSSDNSSVATVSSAGLVTAKAAGSATITVTTQDGYKTATCNVTVKSNNANLSAITLSTGALSPAFNAATTSYTVSVPYETTSISVTGTPAHQSATISGNVTNKALSVGSNSVSLVVTAEDGVTTKTYTVTIVREQQIIAVSDVTMAQTAATLNAGQSLQLQHTVLPQDATNKAVSWSSDNQSVATVSSTGLVTAKISGAATIIVTTADGGKQAYCYITVITPVSGIKLNVSSIKLDMGKSQRLIATVQPTSADNKTVIWTSDNPAVATVDNDGLVFGKAEGVTVITATTQDGSYAASCVIDVVDRTANLSASNFLTVKTLNGAVHIDASQTIENVTVYNVAGVVIYQQQSKTNNVILYQLPARQILIIKIRLADGKVEVRKLII